MITEEQVNQLKALLNEKTQASGGNYRNIQKLNERTVHKFSNTGVFEVKVVPIESESFAMNQFC